jgi:metallophosphoesterase (TIGR00282 family)
MTINVLAVGDVCGKAGLDILDKKLGGIKKNENIAFTVINGENAAGLGITQGQAKQLVRVGADVITLGNHAWGRYEIISFTNDCESILRPANFAPQVPGRGWGVFETDFADICVINLIGRAQMPYGSENPFFEADRILKKVNTNVVLVDFHAETTSEKHALAYHLDGRVSALWGTHTHVQTSDCRIFPGGMGSITDLGMTGAQDSIIGMKPDEPISRFLGNPQLKAEPADGPSKIEGAIFSIDCATGKCLNTKAVRIT